MSVLTSLLKVIGRETPRRVQSDEIELDPWYTREGAAVMAPLELAWAREGRVFVANAGSASAPITFGAGIIDTTEPDFDLLLPAGLPIYVIPLQILIHMEVFGTDALFEYMASYGLGGAQQATGATAVTPRNLRTDSPFVSKCTVYSNSDSGATYMTNEVGEIFRGGIQKVATTATGNDTSNRIGETHIWRAREAGIYPHLGSSAKDARLNVFAAAQGGQGFIEVMYAEVPR